MNTAVLSSRCFIFLATLMICCALSAAGGGKRSKRDLKKEAELKLKQLELRYEDYFKRVKERERWEKKRLSGYRALKKQRQKEWEKHERGRLKFIEQRKFRVIEKWNLPKNYEKYLQQVEQGKKQHILDRKKYRKEQQYLADQINRAQKRLTDKQEYGVEFDRDRTDGVE